LAEKLVPGSIDAVAAPSTDADQLPGFCPRCRGILERARVVDEHPFHLDRCPACRGIWFDSGEWAAVASTEWLHHLDDLWDPVWRKKVRDERADNRHLETIEHALGAETFAKLKAAVDVLRNHPMRSLGLSYLVEELSVARRYDPGPRQD
jgi:Zn-finger nucleic acid-binding protein